MTETSTMTAQEAQDRIAELEAANGSMQAVLDMFRETGRLPDQRTAELERQIAECADWCDEAAEEIEGWGAYASEYFRDKHDLDADIKLFRDRATRLRNGGSDGE